MSSGSEDEIDRAYAQQQAQVIPEIENMGEALDFILDDEADKPEFIKLPGCVYSKDKFAKGWHFNLISLKYASHFPGKKKQLDAMHWKKRASFFFRLTLWFPKRGRTVPHGVTSTNDIQLGSVIVCNEVEDLKAYQDLYPQGSTSAIDLVDPPIDPTEQSVPSQQSTEDAPAARPSKKQKLSLPSA